jgi:hypothetical protein
MQHKCRGCGIFVPERELYSPDDPDDPQAVLLCKGCYMSHFAAEEEEEEEEELNKYMVSVPVIHYYSIGPVEAYDEDEAADEVRENWSEWRHTIEDNGDWGGPTWRYSKCSSMEPEAYEVFDSETFEADDYICECGSTELRYVEYDNHSLNGFFCMTCGLSPCGISETDDKPCTCDLDEFFNRSKSYGAQSFGPVDEEGQLAQALARARAKSQEPHRPLKITKLPHRDQTSLKDFEAESNTPLFTKESKVFAIGLASGIVATIFGNLLSEFVIDRYREEPELSDTEQNA